MLIPCVPNFELSHDLGVLLVFQCGGRGVTGVAVWGSGCVTGVAVWGSGCDWCCSVGVGV